MPDARQFVDANVLVYAFDKSAKAKQVIASQLLEGLWASGVGCASVQVLQEFFVVVTRRVPEPLSIDTASERVRELIAWNIFTPGPNDVLSAIAIHKNARINFWDAMIVHAAAEMGCEVLWTEDLADRQTVGGVAIRNPFAG